MKGVFFPRLAFDGVRKNKRLYTPFILTCTGMVMMYYIILYLACSDVLESLIGGGTLREMFSMGSWVIAVFAAIFLFYTNSFLIRRRKKEFGLYHILGMGKGAIARILFWENLLTAGLSLSLGLIFGVAFSKLAELAMVRIMRGDATYTLSVAPAGILRAVQVFGVIFFLLLLSGIRQVRFASAVSLLRSESVGEKPPKGNWFFGLLGLVLLGAAYTIALTIRDPITAMLLFFVAVVLVILGTYLLMIAGSVFFCRLLQKKKKYYYKPNHFVSVSSMAYRMKRNGAGLASICILATMVLVIMASTTCLYFGKESAVRRRCPRDFNFSFIYETMADFSRENVEKLEDRIQEKFRSRGAALLNRSSYRSADCYGIVKGNEVDLNPAVSLDGADASAVHLFFFVPLEDYNAMTGKHETLAPGEALLYRYDSAWQGKSLTFHGTRSYAIRREIEAFPENGEMAAVNLPGILLVVPDLEACVADLQSFANFQGDSILELRWNDSFDTDLDQKTQVVLYREIVSDLLSPEAKAEYRLFGLLRGCRAVERENFYGMFGSLFYLGILLSLVFLLAAVLILYYKQISEGYEDQGRFEIMQKVGMTKREIRRTVNSQLLTVFFLPLVMAAIHLSFAFPIIRQILLVFNLNNVPLFAATTAVTAAVFALFYTLVYRLTAAAYYKIVSAREVRG